MIDGVKIGFYSTTIINDLLTLGVTVLTPLEEDTGEIHFPKLAKYKTLDFKISASKRVEIKGSLHKYWRGENYSDFTAGELRECISDLCQKFHINLFEARLHNLEFGVNVCPVFNPFEFCGRVIAFRKESFSKFRTSGKSKICIGFEAAQQQYSIKIYDKGKQYFKNDNILRFEIRVIKMEFIKHIGISFLSDILEPEKLSRLGVILNEVFSELIVTEQVNNSDLTANESRIYALCSNPKEWERFTPKQRYNRKKQFEEIIQAKGLTNWKGITAKLISDKWGMLFALTTSKSRHVLTDLQTLKGGDDLTDLPKPEKGLFNCLDNPLIPARLTLPEKRFCKSCGRDISRQKKGSVFCGESFFGKEAKRCRNLNSNPRNNLQRREQRRYGAGDNLFDVGCII